MKRVHIVLRLREVPGHHATEYVGSRTGHVAYGFTRVFERAFVPDEAGPCRAESA